MVTVLPKKRTCLWAAGGCGALLFAGGFVCVFVAFPALVDWQVDINFDLWNKESEGYKNFVSFAPFNFKPQRQSHNIGVKVVCA